MGRGRPSENACGAALQACRAPWARGADAPRSPGRLHVTGFRRVVRRASGLTLWAARAFGPSGGWVCCTHNPNPPPAPRIPMRRPVPTGLAAGLVALTFAGETRPAEPGRELFENKIRPVLVEHCYACHSAKAGKAKGGLLLDTRGGLRKGGDSGAAVEPGPAVRQSYAEGPAVRRRRDCGCRRRGSCRTRSSATSRRGSRRGPTTRGRTTRRRNPRPPTATGRGPSASGAATGAFSPCGPSNRRPSPTGSGPPTRSTASCGRSSTGSASTPRLRRTRRTLIRRVAYALTGLPPTPAEIDAFLADGSPAAYESVVDRLLASPRFGEHVGARTGST